jgi:hypothetical protein
MSFIHATPHSSGSSWTLRNTSAIRGLLEINDSFFGVVLAQKELLL